MSRDKITQTSEMPPFLRAWAESESGKAAIAAMIPGRIDVGDQLPGYEDPTDD